MFNTTATGLAPEIVEFQPDADFHIRAGLFLSLFFCLKIRPF